MTSVDLVVEKPEAGTVLSEGLAAKKARKPRIKTPKKTSIELLQSAVKSGWADEPLFVIDIDHADYSSMEKAGFNTSNVVSFKGERVFVFTRDELDVLIKKGQIFVRRRTESTIANVIWTRTEKMSIFPAVVSLYSTGLSFEAQASVTIGPYDGRASEYFTFIASILHVAVKKPIVLSVPHGKSVKYDPTGPFQIYIWSTPSAEGRPKADRESYTPPSVFGVRVGCKDDPFVPKVAPLVIEGKEHLSVIVREGSYAVAELFPNALYVHHDLVHNGSREELQLFAEILYRCLPHLMGEVSFKKYEASIKQVKHEAELCAFGNLVEMSVTKRATRQENAITAAEQKARDLRDAYFEAERVLFAERQAILTPEVIKIRFVDEYNKLSSGKVDSVSGVTFDPSKPDCIVVHTDEVKIEHPKTGNVHLIGRCDITFNLENGGLEIINRDRVYTIGSHTFYTPHVFQKGCTNVCLGNIERELIAYIANFELEAATALTLAFLQSVKDSSGYIERLECFPIEEKKKRSCKAR